MELSLVLLRAEIARPSAAPNRDDGARTASVSKKFLCRPQKIVTI